MKEKIILMIGIILLMTSFVNATYPGDIYIIDLTGHLDTIENYEIVGNTSHINSTLDGMILKIEIPKDYEPGNFKVLFYGYEDGNPLIVYKEISGGGGRTRYVYVNQTVNQTQIVEKIEYVNQTIIKEVYVVNVTNQTDGEIIKVEKEDVITIFFKNLLVSIKNFLIRIFS